MLASPEGRCGSHNTGLCSWWQRPEAACSWPVGMAGQWAQLQEGPGNPMAHEVTKGQGLPWGQNPGGHVPRSLSISGCTVTVPGLMGSMSPGCPHASHTPVTSHVMSLLCEQFLIFKKFYQKLTIPSLPFPSPALVDQHGPAQLSELQPLAPARSIVVWMGQPSPCSCPQHSSHPP